MSEQDQKLKEELRSLISRYNERIYHLEKQATISGVKDSYVRFTYEARVHELKMVIADLSEYLS